MAIRVNKYEIEVDTQEELEQVLAVINGKRKASTEVKNRMRALKNGRHGFWI